MAKFRKKPVVIEAMQWDGTDERWVEIQNFAHTLINKTDYKKDKIKARSNKIYIETLEGIMIADVYDWIIKGISGEFCPCKPDIFEKTYEPV